MRTYTEKFKNTIIRELERGASLKDVSQQFDVASSTAHGWFQKFKTKKEPKINEIVNTHKPKIEPQFKKLKKRFDCNFKLGVVTAVKKGEKVNDLSSRLNIGRSTIHKWVSMFGKKVEKNLNKPAKDTVFTHTKNAKPLEVKITHEHTELVELQKQLLVVTRQRDFYKNQMTYFMEISLQNA